MKLTDRYVYDVTRRLPETQRSDVAKELTTEIEEMVEDRAAGKRANKHAVYDVLVELGSPSRLADQYRERPRYVIGPEYYESYVFLLKTICAVVLPLLAFIIFMTESMTATHTILSLCMKIIGAMLEVAVYIFFWTTVSFVLVQKFAGGERHDDHWKPEDLPQLPPAQEITRGESFFAIAWSVFAVLATLYQVPAIYQLIGPDTVPQFFAPAMWPGWTLGLLAVALLSLGAEFIKLIVGGWTRVTVGLIVIVNLITVGFFVAALSFVDPIANPDMMRLVAESLGNPNIAQTVEQGIDIFVYVVIAICAWEIGEAVYKYRKGGKK